MVLGCMSMPVNLVRHCMPGSGSWMRASLVRGMLLRWRGDSFVDIDICNGYRVPGYEPHEQLHFGFLRLLGLRACSVLSGRDRKSINDILHINPELIFLGVV